MWVGTSTDIHEIKELDEQKDYFMGMVSHELKTPITTIKGYTQILQLKYSNSEDVFLKNSLDIVNRQLTKTIQLITDLLDVSKIKSGSLSLRKENFSINELLAEVIDEVMHIYPDYHVDFVAENNEMVFADRERIEQVIINLLTNAVKYSPLSKQINVKSYKHDDRIFISVEDFGIGINKADQQKIFERFYRAEGKNENRFPGFGIGLFIASEIVKKHDGKIEVKSQPGKGSTFIFSIPL